MAIRQDETILDSGITVTDTGAIVCEGDGVSTYAALLLWNSLVLECRTGLRMTRAMSAHQVAKRDYNLKGNKLTVLKALGKRFVEHGLITQETFDKTLSEIEAKPKNPFI